MGRAEPQDVVLGFAKLDGILQKQPYFGAVIVKMANGIAKGTFTLDGRECKLAINNRPNMRHQKVSADSEEGYPGELKVCVTYTLDGEELVVSYRASQTTPVDLINHSFFNLESQGFPNRLVYDHEDTIEYDTFFLWMKP
uniref:Galactose mutarotase n=1 Tax=Pipistrellus kuhlii TaxID=59472 RepID=A0A7J8B216_PIPKU|nr:hypothetical protein mPipKuh1_007714 [Pipistrellus kuhlii]